MIHEIITLGSYIGIFFLGVSFGKDAGQKAEADRRKKEGCGCKTEMRIFCHDHLPIHE